MKLTDDNILQANINRTKQYVRDNGGKVSTLPTATSSNVGQIYQYTGATTLTYTHGYFYECKENNGTYSWENVPVGEGSGDVSDSTTTITASTATYPEYSAGETLKVIFGKIKKFLSDLKGNKTDLTNLATVESTTTASKAYSAEDWLIFNGQLYKVTAPISSGGTITIGTNVEPTTVEDGKSSGGGHTILDSSGTAMAQRANLQFDGATVTDDPANDKTIVTGTPQSMIGDAWVTSHAYAVGDYCIDGNVLYKCKTAHTSSASNRPPYASYWTVVSVSDELLGDWKLFTTMTGTSWTNLPTSYRELMFVPNCNSCYPSEIVPKTLIDTFPLQSATNDPPVLFVTFSVRASSSTTFDGGAWLQITKDKVKINNQYYAGLEITKNVTIYYR